MFRQHTKTIIICSWLVLGGIAVAEPGSGNVRLYLDADRTGTRASGVSMEQGIRTALSEVGNRLGGREVELVIKDHRGNSRRSKRHLDAFLADKQALAVFCGLHSPPVLAHREFINKNGILLLDPWAAAGPITRYPSAENWIFRLSVDDSKAGYVITHHAVKVRGFRKVALVLEDTGWGKSNHRTMTAALKESDLKPVAVQWFNWNLSESGAKIMLHDVVASGADVVFLVANAPEGKAIAGAMAALPAAKRLPICSHWGITGGDFAVAIDYETRQKIDLSFIQTRFSFLDAAPNSFGATVLDEAKALFPTKIRTARDIKAPAGFIHAYDLTRLLIAAVRTSGLSGNTAADRRAVRAALEQLDKPVPGLLKTYMRPFRPFTEHDPDAHEALAREDFTMARYGEHGEIIISKE